MSLKSLSLSPGMHQALCVIDCILLSIQYTYVCTQMYWYLYNCTMVYRGYTVSEKISLLSQIRQQLFLYVQWPSAISVHLRHHVVPGMDG